MSEPAIVESATISTAAQLAPDNVPKLQNVIERACGSRAMYERKPIALMNNAFTASPVSNNITIDARPSSLERARRKTRYVEITPPIHAAIGKLQRLVPPCNHPPHTKKSADPKAAPLEVPTSPGSTIGLRNNACINVPPTPRLAPTSRHRIARGKRSSRKIR